MNAVAGPEAACAAMEAGTTEAGATGNHRAVDLMDRLHRLDAALTACQRQAIAVDELRAVWELHSSGLEHAAGEDPEWVDALMRQVAKRHGILGLVLAGPGQGGVTSP